MSLRIYDASGGNGLKSSDQSYTNPFKYETPVSGGTYERRYFIRSNDPSQEAFTDCSISSLDAVAPNEASWFKFAPDVGGSPGTYSSSEIKLNGLAKLSSAVIGVALPLLNIWIMRRPHHRYQTLPCEPELNR